jgi:hypothetical protein
MSKLLIRQIQAERIKNFGKSPYDEANLSYTSIRTKEFNLNENSLIKAGGRVKQGMREGSVLMEGDVSQQTEPIPEV